MYVKETGVALEEKKEKSEKLVSFEKKIVSMCVYFFLYFVIPLSFLYFIYET